MNIVVISGRLTDEPKVTRPREDLVVAEMRVAVRRNAKETDYVTVTAFSDLAEACETRLESGQVITVNGRLRHHEYEVEGEPRQRLDVVAREIVFGVKPKRGANESSEPFESPADAEVSAN